MKTIFGFTLIELIVAVSIIMVIAAGAVPVMRTFRARTELKNAAVELQALLREGETNASSGNVRGCTGGTTMLYGWAVELQTGGTSATLNQVCADFSTATFQWNAGKTLSFAPGIEISSVSLGNIFIVFRPVSQLWRYSAVTSQNTFLTGQDMTVTLMGEGGTTIVVTLQKTGNVDVQE